MSFASPCKDKEDAVSKAVFNVGQAEKEYRGARNIAILYGMNALGSALDEAVQRTTRSPKTRRKNDAEGTEAGKAVIELKKAKDALDAARKAEEDAKKALQDCLEKHKCPKCGILSNHLAASCDTCDATSFYTCQHKCPNIPRCGGCDAQIVTEQDKEIHKQILCSGNSCNDTYYLCNSNDANQHRPRVCVRSDGYYHNGQYYHMVDGMLYEGMRYCNTTYRECSNSTCSIHGLLEHTDYGAADGECPVCSGISYISKYCVIHD